MFLRKYIVKCNIDLEHNVSGIGVAGPEFMNPLHNSFNWIFQISHHTQIINIHCSGETCLRIIRPFVFNFEVISTYRCWRVFVRRQLCPQDLCSHPPEATTLKGLAELSLDQQKYKCFLIGASYGVKRMKQERKWYRRKA